MNDGLDGRVLLHPLERILYILFSSLPFPIRFLRRYVSSAVIQESFHFHHTHTSLFPEFKRDPNPKLVSHKPGRSSGYKQCFFFRRADTVDANSQVGSALGALVLDPALCLVHQAPCL